MLEPYNKHCSCPLSEEDISSMDKRRENETKIKERKTRNTHRFGQPAHGLLTLPLDSNDILGESLK